MIPAAKRSKKSKKGALGALLLLALGYGCNANSPETKFLLARAIEQLGEREKIVLVLYYYEGMTLAEIGRVLGVTESRISQMHTAAMLRLRAKLSESERS